MEAKYSLIAASLIISSAIISMTSIEHFVTDRQNTLMLENGKIRLGKVYEERINTDVEVINKEDNSNIMSIKSPTKDIFEKAETYIKD